jgi:sec-independent protein translocase protein TatC
MALIFQMPVIITALIKLGVVPLETITVKRREVYAGLLIFAAIMPPTDIISLIILTCAPLFLFEFALLLNRKSI